MRWTVIGLFLVNVVFFLWGWLEYSHSRSVDAMNIGTVALEHANMPGAKIELLKDSSQTVSLFNQSPQGVVVNAVQPAVSASEVQLCVLLGPYPESQGAKVLIDKLGALQIRAEYASVRVEGEPDYWVYMAPEPTKELAALKLKELQEKKIDSFIIPQGDLANGISLGVFDRQENAESRRKAIAELGYAVQMQVNVRNYLENWVVLYPNESAKFSPELYGQLHGENNNMDLRKDECGKVASVIDIH